MGICYGICGFKKANDKNNNNNNNRLHARYNA